MLRVRHVFLFCLYLVCVPQLSGSEEGGLVFCNTLTQSKLSGQRLSTKMDVCSARAGNVLTEPAAH